jgi:hypothetical protein
VSSVSSTASENHIKRARTMITVPRRAIANSFIAFGIAFLGVASVQGDCSNYCTNVTQWHLCDSAWFLYAQPYCLGCQGTDSTTLCTVDPNTMEQTCSPYLDDDLNIRQVNYRIGTSGDDNCSCTQYFGISSVDSNTVGDLYPEMNSGNWWTCGGTAPAAPSFSGGSLP